MSYRVKTGGHSESEHTNDAVTSGFQTFEDLEVYRVSREFRKRMYEVTRCLPEFEKYGLCSQIRRAAVSLTNNIAEGHGRFHYPDQIRFILNSRGSLEELVDDLNVCLDERYLPPDEISNLKGESRIVLRLINGYLRHLRRNCLSVREPDELYPESPAQFSPAVVTL